MVDARLEGRTFYFFLYFSFNFEFVAFFCPLFPSDHLCVVLSVCPGRTWLFHVFVVKLVYILLLLYLLLLFECFLIVCFEFLLLQYLFEADVDGLMAIVFGDSV